MFVDQDGAAVTPPQARDGPLVWVQEVLAAHPGLLAWDPERAGLDVRAANVLALGPNRARLKVFSPRPGTLVLFVYKDSQIPLSEDRFAYGALILKGQRKPAGEVSELLEYLLCGLHPDCRPSSLKRALPFTVPR